MIPARQIRATYDDETVTVYQAYGHAIADAALAAGTLTSPFSRTRMTWIKPSFLWMMYRCGWGEKPGQERVLAIRMTRMGFEEALAMSCLSHFDPTLHSDGETWRAALRASPVLVQWDPERNLSGEALPFRSLQVGLSGNAVDRYVDEWIVGLEDITPTLAARRAGVEPIPDERTYPLPTPLAVHLKVTR
ncbi:MAG: DUF4291 domain-containing protein [Actinomycetales bacterium]|nr:DUF4291 domain-containing protein [Actinomycetales bacterium]